MQLSNEFQFEKNGFKKEFIKPNAIREELQKHFEKHKFTPHAVRHSLSYFVFECHLTKEQEKAFSKNIGHKNIFTTENSYYNMSEIQKTSVIQEFDIEKMRRLKQIRKTPEYKYVISKLETPETIEKVLKFLAETI